MFQIENLVFDEMDIQTLSTADRDYLQQFTAVETLSFNTTQLKSLANLPVLGSLVRLELAGNSLGGGCLSELGKYAETLRTLKVQENQF